MITHTHSERGCTVTCPDDCPMGIKPYPSPKRLRDPIIPAPPRLPADLMAGVAERYARGPMGAVHVERLDASGSHVMPLGQAEAKRRPAPTPPDSYTIMAARAKLAPPLTLPLWPSWDELRAAAEAQAARGRARGFWTKLLEELAGYPLAWRDFENDAEEHPPVLVRLIAR